MTEEKSSRVYPRRHLRGPIEVVHSARLKFPKFHMVLNCDGIERTPEDARTSVVFDDARALGLDFSGRPCRNCTLESVLITTLKPSRKEPMVFVSATSQANPLDPGSKVHSYKWRESSDSGKARLLRVAKKVGLSTTSTSVGPVLFGFVPESGAHILAHNLRTFHPGRVEEMPPAEAVDCAWTLLGDAPPELGLGTGVPDAWQTAMALMG